MLGDDDDGSDGTADSSEVVEHVQLPYATGSHVVLPLLL